MKFECQILNSRTIEWFYDDVQITDAVGTEILFDEESGATSLTIENICVEDEGDYTVKAINEFGVTSKTARLTVTGNIDLHFCYMFKIIIFIS